MFRNTEANLFWGIPDSKPDQKPKPSCRISAIIRQFDYCHTIF